MKAGLVRSESGLNHRRLVTDRTFTAAPVPTLNSPMFPSMEIFFQRRDKLLLLSEGLAGTRHDLFGGVAMLLPISKHVSTYTCQCRRRIDSFQRRRETERELFLVLNRARALMQLPFPGAELSDNRDMLFTDARRSNYFYYSGINVGFSRYAD